MSHWRGDDVDVEALQLQSPLRQGTGKGLQMRSRGNGSLRRRKSGFVDALIFLGILGNIYAKELGQGSSREATSLVAAGPPGHDVRACGLPVGLLPWPSSPLIFFCSGKIHFGYFIPFGLRSKIRSEKSQKHKKKQELALDTELIS